MKKRGYKLITLDELTTRQNTMRNYIIEYSYISPRLISQYNIHIGLGSDNHAETLQQLFKKEFGTTGKIVAIYEDVRKSKSIGIGTPNSYLDL